MIEASLQEMARNQADEVSDQADIKLEVSAEVPKMVHDASSAVSDLAPKIPLKYVRKDSEGQGHLEKIVMEILLEESKKLELGDRDTADFEGDDDSDWGSDPDYPPFDAEGNPETYKLQDDSQGPVQEEGITDLNKGDPDSGSDQHLHSDGGYVLTTRTRKNRSEGLLARIKKKTVSATPGSSTLSK